MVKEDIETVIDRLYDYINVNKTTSVKNAAAILGLPEEQVEKLAFLLEDSNLIEVRYSLSGAQLVSKQPRQPVALASEAEKKSVEGEAGLLGEQVENAESIAEFMEKDLLRRLKDAEANLKALESQKKISKEQVAKLESEMEFISDKLSGFEATVKKIESEGGSLTSEIDVFKKRLKSIEGGGKYEKTALEKLTEFLVFYILFLRNILAGMRRKKQPSAAKESKVEVKQEAGKKAKEKAKAKAQGAAPATGVKPLLDLEIKLPKPLAKMLLPEKPFEGKEKVEKPKVPATTPAAVKPLPKLLQKPRKPIAAVAKARKRPAHQAVFSKRGKRRILVHRKDRVAEHYWRKKTRRRSSK